jgi:hypothetical protein
MNPAAYLVDELGAIPHLAGALCRPNPPRFDLDNPPTTIAAAVATCYQCPALDACTRWVDNLPSEQLPSGVVAGRLMAPRNTVGIRQRRQDDTTKWLHRLLSRGPRLNHDIYDAAAKNERLASHVKHAAAALQVVKRRDGRSTEWSLPRQENKK